MTRRTDLGRGDEIALTPGQLASLIVNAWANEVRLAVAGRTRLAALS